MQQFYRRYKKNFSQEILIFSNARKTYWAVLIFFNLWLFSLFKPIPKKYNRLRKNGRDLSPSVSRNSYLMHFINMLWYINILTVILSFVAVKYIIYFLIYILNISLTLFGVTVYFSYWRTKWCTVISLMSSNNNFCSLYFTEYCS